MRRGEDITEALWGLGGPWPQWGRVSRSNRVSPGTISSLNQKIYKQIEAWRNRPIACSHPYLDGIVVKRTWAGEAGNVSLSVATGIDHEGSREIFGIVKGAKEDKAGWHGFAAHLMQRGLNPDQVIAKLDRMRLKTAAEPVRCKNWYSI